MKLVISLSTLAVLLMILLVFANTFFVNVFSGRVHFPKQHIGQDLIMEDGEKFAVFRRLRIGGKTDVTDGCAAFKVRFQFKSFTPSTNKRLSMIPAPFLIGMKGFREKYWTINENTDYFQGIYQWESREMAERYPDSFIFKLMTKRSTLEHCHMR